MRQLFRRDVLPEMAVQIINGEADSFREIGIFRIVVRLHQATEGDDKIDEEGEGHQSFSAYVAIEFHGKGGDDPHDFLELDVIQVENGGNRGRGSLFMLRGKEHGDFTQGKGVETGKGESGNVIDDIDQSHV